MLSSLPKQILVERLDFAFIADIEFEKLPPFCSSCKMIGYYISKYRRYPNNLNNTIKLPTILSKPIVVQYKHMIIQTKETNDAPHKKVVRVKEKQNFAVEIQIYDVLVRDVGVVEVEGAAIDLDTLVKVVVGQVETGSLVGQKSKKYAEDIGVGSEFQDDIFTNMPCLEDVHESNDLLKKMTLCLLKILVF